MLPKLNPKKLNKLQFKTLAIMQEFAATDIAEDGENDGEVKLNHIPRPHGNHFHVGSGVVLTKDATGLFNRGAWAALDRKGLTRGGIFPFTTTPIHKEMDYDTGMREQLVHGSYH